MKEPSKQRGRPCKETSIETDLRRIRTDSVYREANGFPPLYHLTLTLGNEVYQSEAPTLLEALKALPKPQKIMVKGKLVLSQGEKKKEWLYMPMMARRLFYPLTQSVLAKTMLFGF